MAHTTLTLRGTALFASIAAATFFSSSVTAQVAAPPANAASAPAAPASLAPVTITGKAPAPASVAGWGDTPLSQAPVAATSIDAAQIRDAGARRLADLTRFDPSVTTAYDAEGYIDYFTIRGFVVDNRFNFRRDGLPINAETSIPLENKARVDTLKGLSGLQAGTSAPGGLVDLVVKRPLDASLRSAYIEWRERGSVLGSVDISQRFGINDAFGVRLNAGAERIDPIARNAKGHRDVLALAADWRASAATLVEAEIENSHRSQPSVPGLSLLGESVPTVPDPKLNLNNQPWSLPVVFDATTASLRVTQKLGEGWRIVAHGLVQRLRTDDRIAFPFGCGAEENFRSYCSDGTFDLYDFRSENERRRSSTLDISLHGAAATGALAHELGLGVQRNVVRNSFQDQIFTVAGTGNVAGTLVTPPGSQDPSPQANRSEHSTELSLRDAIAIGRSGTTAWLGARHTRLARSTAPTSGTDAPTAFEQTFTTPFAALTQALAPGQLVYASWGQGVESDVAPTVPLDPTATPPVPRYTNAGEALPASKSRQVEIGAKGSSERAEWSAAAFDIRRPRFDDIGRCGPLQCTRGLVGNQRHQGVEGSAAWRGGAWGVRAGAQWLHARVEGTGDPTLDGKKPTNVPALTARLQTDWQMLPSVIAATGGLRLLAAGTYESPREVLPDNSARIPSVTKFDLGARYATKSSAGTTWTLRAGIDNVFDRRAWRESPYQFSHAYLFPLEPRTVRISLQADL
ncbi:MAG: TonB-dependent siderophore receptor [Pseudomonadota bacterium]|nr:TonB-dependent siderophore receptor [Pseudomonadota bacterium]